MPAPPPPLHLHPQFGPYAMAGTRADAYVPPLEPGDRVGGPPPRRRRRRVGSAMLLLALGGLAAWVAREKPDEMAAFVSQATAMLDGMKPERRIVRPPAEEVARASEPLQLPLPQRDVAPTGPAMPQEAAENRADADPLPAPAPSAAMAKPEADNPSPSDITAPGARLPDVVADPADALQLKALAAGLHPALSRTLLQQLTAEDFRNAAYAVNAVLKGETHAEAPFVWPRRSAPHRARFKIRLVEGAPTECRRYVVQVAKDGWETTARPMERCGAVQAFKPS